MSPIDLAIKQLPQPPATVRDTDGAEWTVLERSDHRKMVDGEDILTVAFKVQKGEEPPISCDFIMWASELAGMSTRDHLHDYVDVAFETFLYMLHPHTKELLL